MTDYMKTINPDIEIFQEDKATDTIGALCELKFVQLSPREADLGGQAGRALQPG